MSLVSARNLVAPFTNIVHIITILLVAISFAVLRLSGAGFSVKESTSINSTNDFKTRNTINTNSIINEAPYDATTTNNIETVPRIVDNSLEDSSAAEAKKKGLADIEKSLGIK
jgi:hypothetical protein